MADEWPMVKLSDVATINPPRKVKKGELVPFVEMAALPLSGRDIATTDVETRTAKAAGAHFQNGDTLLARITPCLENGKTAQVKVLPNGEIGEGSTEFIVLCGQDPADNDFVYYLCRDPEFRKFAISRMEGTSGRQRVAWQSIAGYQLELPEPETRRAAAEFLATLDDRIENLRQTNATLEAIAQALFKSWFVNFDGLSPEDMRTSELGLIPKGWRFGTLADLCELKYGKALKASERREGEVPVYGSGGIIGYHDEALVRKPTIIVGRKGTVGTLYWQSAPCFPIDTVFYVEPKVSLHFCHYTMKRLGLHKLNTDAAVPGLNRDNAYRQDVIVPSDDALTRWDSFMSRIRARMDNVDEQATTLAALRDTLLPRLISGELKVAQ